MERQRHLLCHQQRRWEYLDKAHSSYGRFQVWGYVWPSASGASQRRDPFILHPREDHLQGSVSRDGQTQPTPVADPVPATPDYGQGITLTNNYQTYSDWSSVDAPTIGHMERKFDDQGRSERSTPTIARAVPAENRLAPGQLLGLRTLSCEESSTYVLQNIQTVAQFFFCKFFEHQTEGGFWFCMLR